MTSQHEFGPRVTRLGMLSFISTVKGSFFSYAQVTIYSINLGLEPIFFQWEHGQKGPPYKKCLKKRWFAWHTSWGPEVNTSSSRHLLAPALDAGMFPLLCGLKPIKERKRSHPGHTRTVYLNHHWRGPPHFGPEPKYKQLWGKRSRVLYFLMFFSVHLSHPAPLLQNSEGCSGHLCWNKSL